MKKKFLNIIILILLILCTCANIQKYMQNDTFFTIANGENILKEGISSEEKLVWHEGLEYTNSRWIFDVLITIIYNNFDFLGVYVFVLILGSITIMIQYLVFEKITNKKILSLFLIFINTYGLSNAFCARAQIVSFLIFLLEFIVLEKLTKEDKLRYYILLIVFSLIIANVHASIFPMYFVIMMPYLAEIIVNIIKNKSKIETNEDRKIFIENKMKLRYFIGLFAVCLAMGILVPEGVKPFSDFINVMNGISKDIIQELGSIKLIDEPLFFGEIILVVSILIFSKTKIRLRDALFILGFMILSLNTYRSIFYFYLISSICIVRVLNDFLNNYKYGEIKEYLNLKFKKAIKIFETLLFCAFFVIYIYYFCFAITAQEYIATSYYPVYAVDYMILNLNTENMKIYNHINYGSYLELRGIKAFADTRTGVFTDEFNEGCTILEDIVSVASCEVNYNEIFDKYGIEYVLIENNEMIKVYIDEDTKWNLIYSDINFSLYEKEGLEK